MLKLVSGTAFAQFITVISAPLLARFYSPALFGTYGLFTSITSIIAVIACLRYELSIMLPEKDSEACNLLSLSIILSLIISFISFIVIYLGQNSLLHLLNAEELGSFLYLVAPSIFFTSAFMALNYWNSRTKQFGRLSIARICSSLITVAIQLSAGFMGYATSGILIGASIIGSAISTLVLGAQIVYDDYHIFHKNITWRAMREGLIRYKKFPIYETFGALLNNISWQLPIFMLSSFFSSTVVGYYVLGKRILSMPMSLIGMSIAQVFYQRASEEKRNGMLAKVVENVFHRLVKLGLLPFIILTVIGDDLFEIVFGSNWIEAGVYTQILSIWTFFWFISSPMSVLFRVLERQEFSLKINIAIFITRFLSLLIGGYVGSPRWAMVLFALSGIVIYGYLSMSIMFVSGIPWGRMFEILLRNIKLSLPVITILIIMKLINVSSIILLLATSICMIIFAFYVYKTDPEIKKMLKI